jgi:hypothetical protein
MPRPSTSALPPDLRARLEAARLDSLALFRALDQLAPTAIPLPQRLLHQLFELDADCAEALWVLDQPPQRFDLEAMLHDTLATLEQLPQARARFRKKIPPSVRPALETLESTVRKTLNPAEAYSQVPGRDPHSG